jgi:hypothetical protein
VEIAKIDSQSIETEPQHQEAELSERIMVQQASWLTQILMKMRKLKMRVREETV